MFLLTDTSFRNHHVLFVQMRAQLFATKKFKTEKKFIEFIKLAAKNGFHDLGVSSYEDYRDQFVTRIIIIKNMDFCQW